MASGRFSGTFLSRSALQQDDETDDRPVTPTGSAAGSVFSGDSIIAINREIDHIKDLLNLTGSSNPPAGTTSYARDVFRRSYRVNISHARIYQELDSLKEMLGNPSSRPVSPEAGAQKPFGEPKAFSLDGSPDKIKELTTQLELSSAEHEKALKEAEELRQQHADSLSSLQAANRKIEDLESRRLANSTSLGEAHEQIQRLENSLKETRAAHADSSREVSALKASEEEHSRALDNAQSEINASKARYEEISASLVQANAAKDRFERDHKDSSQSLAEANSLVAQWQSHHQKPFSQFMLVEEQRDQHLNSLETQIASLKSQHKDSAVLLEHLKLDHAKLQETHNAEIAGKDEELDRVRSGLEERQREADGISNQHATALRHKDQEITAANERNAALMREKSDQALEHENQIKAMAEEHTRLLSEAEDRNTSSIAARDEQLRHYETSMRSTLEDHNLLRKSIEDNHMAALADKDNQIQEHVGRLDSIKEEMLKQQNDAEVHLAAALAAKDNEHGARIEAVQDESSQQLKNLQENHRTAIAAKDEELKKREQELQSEMSQQKQDAEEVLNAASDAHAASLRENEEKVRKLSKKEKYFDDVKRDYERRLGAVSASLEQQHATRERETDELTEKVANKEKELKKLKRDQEMRLKAIRDEKQAADEEHSQAIADLEKRIGDLQTSHVTILQSKADEYEDAKKSQDEEHLRTMKSLEERINALESSHAAALSSKDQAYEADVTALKDEHSRAIGDFEKQIQDRDTSHSSALQSMEQEYQEAKQAQEDNHIKAVGQLQEQLQQQDASHSAALLAKDAEFQELTNAHETHSRQLQEDHERQLQGNEEEHQTALDAWDAKILNMYKEHEKNLHSKEEEIQSMQANHDSQIAEVHQIHQQQLAAKDDQLQQIQNEHESHTRELETNHQSLIKSKDEELHNLKEEHSKRVADLKSSHSTVLAEKDNNLQSMREHHEQSIKKLETDSQWFLTQQQEDASAAKRDLQARLEELHKLRRSEISEIQMHSHISRTRNEERIKELEDSHAGEVTKMRADSEAAVAEHSKRVRELNDELSVVRAQADEGMEARQNVQDLEKRLEERTVRSEGDIKALQSSHEQRLQLMQAEYEAQITATKEDAATSKAAALAEMHQKHTDDASDTQRRFEEQLSSQETDHKQSLSRAIQLEREKASSNENSVRQMVAAELDRKHRYALKEVEKTYSALGGEQERQLTAKLEKRHQDEIKQLEDSWKSVHSEKERQAREIGYTEAATAHESQLTNLKRDHSSAMSDKDERIQHLESLTKTQSSEIQALEQKAALAQSALETIRHDTDDQLTNKFHSLQQELATAISKRSQMEQELTRRSVELSASQRDLQTASRDKNETEEQLVSLMAQVAAIRQGLEEKAKMHMDTEMENKALITRIYSLRQDLREAIDKRAQAEKSRDALLAEPPSLLAPPVKDVQPSALSADTTTRDSSSPGIDSERASIKEKLTKAETENSQLNATLNDLRGRFQEAQSRIAIMEGSRSSSNPPRAPHKISRGVFQARASPFESQLLAAQRELAQLGKVIAQNENLFAIKVEEHLNGLQIAKRASKAEGQEADGKSSFESLLSAAQSELIEMGTIISSNEALFARKILEHVRLLRLTENSLAAEYREKFSEMLIQKSKLQEDLATKYAQELARAKSVNAITNVTNGAAGPSVDNTKPALEAKNQEQMITPGASRELNGTKDTDHLVLLHIPGFQRLVDEYDERVMRLVGDVEPLPGEMHTQPGQSDALTSSGSTNPSNRVDFAPNDGRPSRAVSGQIVNAQPSVRLVNSPSVPPPSAMRNGNSGEVRNLVRQAQPVDTLSGSLPPAPPPKSRMQAPSSSRSKVRSLASESATASSSATSHRPEASAASRRSGRFSDLGVGRSGSLKEGEESALGGVKSRSSLTMTRRGLVRSTGGSGKHRSNVTCNFW